MYGGTTGLSPYSPSHQPRLYHAGSPLTPPVNHTLPQFSTYQNRQSPLSVHYNSPHTPRMDTSFPGPPSPSSPYISSSPTIAYQTGSNSALIPSRPYMSPSLTNRLEGLGTSSPALMTSSLLPDTSYDSHQSTSEQYRPVLLHDFQPRVGNQGTQVVIKADVDLQDTPSPSGSDSSNEEDRQAANGKLLRLLFGVYPVQTAVITLSSNGRSGRGQYCQMTAIVPSWSTTGTVGRNTAVQVYVQIMSQNQAVLDTIPLGEFNYTATSSRATNYTGYNQPSNPLKRGGDVLEASRPSPSMLHHRVLSEGPHLDSPEMGSYAQLPVTYQPGHNAASTYTSPYIASASLPPIPAPAPYSPPSQPSLMRATQVYQPPPNIPIPSQYVQNTSGKAVLELTGDLTAMAKGWTTDEWNSRRRLVQFWRRQDGTTIFAAFRPLSQQDYPNAQNSIIISCIFREDKNTCFVTSVDAIYLLEALVGTRFTVEEKNRIRRNLEGFRPITVSKNKPGSEDFFKLIMGFPNPKPRNIEKDVKVFPWDILGPALKKIIGKYSASYPYSGGGATLAPPTQDSPIMYSTPLMPAPVPLQPSSHDSYTHSTSHDSYTHASSSSSAPQLQSHTSSDSSVYQSSSSYQPQTPQMTHSHSGGSPPRYLPHTHSQQSHFSNSSLPQDGKHEHNYGTLSPSHQHAHLYEHTPSYWAHEGHGGEGPQHYVDGATGTSALGFSSGVENEGTGDGSHHYSHPHGSASSGDLRVAYPGMSQ